MTPRLADHRAHAQAAWRAALAAADPREAVRRVWDTAVAKQPDKASLKLLAIGKASIEMAMAACECIEGDARAIELRKGFVTAVPERLTASASAQLSKCNVRAVPADHPLPTLRNVEAARMMGEFLDSCEPEEVLLVLLSGGGSAHLASPIDGVSLDELKAVSSALMSSGATIHELNCVRKHLEKLKGGRSAARCRAGKIIVLVLSDVIGDSLDVISSGPFAPDPTTFADAIQVMVQRRVASTHPGVMELLLESASREPWIVETPKPGDAAFARDRVRHIILASNKSATSAVEASMREIGFLSGACDNDVQGEASTVARDWIGRSLAVERGRANSSAAFILGGETTVAVGAHAGLGGPSQEFALAGAEALGSVDLRGRRAALLTFSTDGLDGPTDAAGALVTDQSWTDLVNAGVNPAIALADHNSHHALDRVHALIRTGATGTNVNHIAVLLLYAS